MMIDPWPADVAHIRAAQDDPRSHESGRGPFVLITTALLFRDGGTADFRCVHRFMTRAAREEYRVDAVRHGLTVEVVE